MLSSIQAHLRFETLESGFEDGLASSWPRAKQVLPKKAIAMSEDLQLAAGKGGGTAMMERRHARETAPPSILGVQARVCTHVCVRTSNNISHQIKRQSSLFARP